ncbi:hypothetical protein [Mesorhizobium sp. RMAD-H1]|uniref:hypothetical protein n=1 Tax=Mesorhizobium sp. RMAD-H1 TaxID=2587065 RepID=UPI001619B19D|nr:hypothetical protein [Mesorhizobium sp. RMAD-H1]
MRTRMPDSGLGPATFVRRQGRTHPPFHAVRKGYPLKIRASACKSLELPCFTGYLARTGEVAEWSKALPC